MQHYLRHLSIALVGSMTLRLVTIIDLLEFRYFFFISLVLWTPLYNFLNFILGVAFQDFKEIKLI